MTLCRFFNQFLETHVYPRKLQRQFIGKTCCAQQLFCSRQVQQAQYLPGHTSVQYHMSNDIFIESKWLEWKRLGEIKLLCTDKWKKYLTIFTIKALEICSLFRMIVADGRHAHGGHGRDGRVVPSRNDLFRWICLAFQTEKKKNHNCFHVFSAENTDKNQHSFHPLSL